MGTGMNLELIVEISALGLALIAARLSLGSAPALDWERLLKVALCTVIRGQVEAGGGEGAQWWAQLRGVVPYHPAGRDPEDKLRAPSLEAIPVPALAGERALVEALQEHKTAAARWPVMYEGEATEDALLSDPALLGRAYDPAAVLAPGVGWEAVAAWSDDVQSALARRLSDVVLLVVGGDFARPLSQAVPHARVASVVPASADIVGPALMAALPAASDRAVILAGGTDVVPVLRAMHAQPALRDRVLVVLSMGGALGGDWMQRRFIHAEMDTELNRTTAYMDIVDVNPENPLATSWAEQRFPQPERLPSGWSPIERVGLGVLPLALQDPVALARAIWVLLAFRLVSR
jgi:hypothetical protein